ncbi:MAG: SMC-Scp complex subunit ScpB [Candidatus Lokiarchaeota archaeon]|nr:SMC-Scp complex subunit ScpB [Candidatus Lokiarchaeota archaeon]
MIPLVDDKIILEAALYVAGRPLTLEELSEIIGKAQSTTQKLLEDLIFSYHKKEGALEVIALPRDRYVMQLKPELTPSVGRLIPGGLLSFSTLQTLVFIALKQPLLQSDLVNFRGTHVYEHVKELEDKKFIDAAPEGRSKLLKTTPLFADYFGLDHDPVRLKAQLKHKMKKILEEQKRAEEEQASAFD